MAMNVVESSCNLENTIKPSDEFLQIFKLTCTFSRDSSKLSKKQIRTIETKMNKLFHKVINLKDVKFDDIIILASIYQQVCYGYIKLNQKEKLSAAKDFALRCLHLIKDKELDPKIIFLTLRVYSHLGLIYYKQQKMKNAIEIYDKAIELYTIYIEERSEDGDPIDHEDIVFKSPVELNSYVKLKGLYLFNLYTLLDIHVEIRSETNESFMLCLHLSLTDEFNNLQTANDYKQWIKKAIKLCDCLIMCNRFKEAKSYTDTAIFVQKVYIHDKLNTFMELEDSPSKKSELYEQSLVTSKSLHQYQARYGIAFFRQSVARMLRLEKNEEIYYKANDSTTEHPSKSKKLASRKPLLAPNPRAHVDKNIMFPIKYISNYNEAQKMFINILAVIHKLGDFNSELDLKLYVQCVLYTCNVYKYMAFYEKNTTSRLLLQKRRIEFLEEAVDFLKIRNDNLLRYLGFQLAIAYSTLIDMSLEDIVPLFSHMSEKYNTLIVEINLLVAKGLLFLRMYMNK